MLRRAMADRAGYGSHRSPGDNPPWPLLGTILAFVAGFVLMTSPWLLGYASIPWDAKGTFLPQVQFMAQSLWRGEWPWWNPYVFSGLPQVADPQSMLFSPPFMLLALINPSPGTWAGDTTVLAAMAVGSAGLIVWFKDREWHWAGALVAALTFSFGAAMGWRLQHWGQVLSMAYLPWILLFLDRALERSSVSAGLGAGLIAAFMVLGRDQIALLAVYILAARVVCYWAACERPLQAVGQSLAPLVGGGLIGGVVVAIPVLMTVVLAAQSNRPSIDFAGAGAGSLHPALMTTFVIPHVFAAASAVLGAFWGPPSFAWVGTGLYTAQNVGQLYLGAIPLLLIVGAAVAGRLWDRDIRFFSIAFLAMLLFALGWYTPLFWMAHTFLPGIAFYRRPADAVFLIGGLGAILAGYGVHVWFAEPWRRPSRRLVAAVCCVVGIAFLAALFFALQIGRVADLPRPLAMAAGWLGLAAAALAWSAPRVALSPWHAALALGLVTAADLGLNNGPTSSSALPPAMFDVLEPDTHNATIRFLEMHVVDNATRRDRIELAGLGFHWPNASITHRLENTLGYNPVRPALYSQATGAEDHVGLPEQRKFSPLMPSYKSRLADMLGLRWIVTGAPIETIDKRISKTTFPLVAKFGNATIYENAGALPRALFVPSARAASFEDILDSGVWPDFDPTRSVLLALPSEAGTGRRPGTVRITAYGLNRIELDAESPDGGWVVLNDVWHPWWFAECDGRPVTLERANVLFRAVAVPPGRHSIRMTFEPLTGLWQSLRSRHAGGRHRDAP